MARKDTMGVFTLRNEGDGCLTSKYLEHEGDTPYTEAPSGDDIATLTISRPDDTYVLKWTNRIKDRTSTFSGKAMSFENKLVGCYWMDQ